MLLKYCGAVGFAGWLVMLLVWAALVSLVVWGITRLFPDSPRIDGPTVDRDGCGEEVSDVPVESGRR